MICKTPLDTESAYRVDIIVNKRTGEKELTHKYCCSEEEFQAEEERKKKAQEDKDRVYYLICDIMGEKEIISTALFKEWAIWNKVADNEKIAKYLVENRDYLSSVIARLGSSEYARIRYLSTIIRDKIKAFVPKVEVAEKPKVVVDETIYEAPTQSLNKRRSLADLEDMF
jgi:hypothetical protein